MVVCWEVVDMVGFVVNWLVDCVCNFGYVWWEKFVVIGVECVGWVVGDGDCGYCGL